ncbi:NAD(P)-binding protein [Micromonospora sp. ATA32]|nr:NAD(P)-binding protein [Micromonospora sp. ATA32]
MLAAEDRRVPCLRTRDGGGRAADPVGARSWPDIILGAGLCGLACADELMQLDPSDWLNLEASATAGGLASSVIDSAGFTWDLGGHVVFSHFGEFDRLLSDLFRDGELLRYDRPRSSASVTGGSLIPSNSTCIAFPPRIRQPAPPARLRAGTYASTQ